MFIENEIQIYKTIENLKENTKPRKTFDQLTKSQQNLNKTNKYYMNTLMN